QGDLGQSYSTRRLVGPELAAVIPGTLILAIAGLLSSALLGLSGGVLAALHHGRWPDRAIRIAISALLAVPSFWLGLLFILLFVRRFAEKLGWLPAGGFGLDSPLLLPALALSTAPAAGAARLVRSSLLEVLKLDFVRTAHAYGLKPAIVTWRHVLPNALLPA